MKKKPVLVVIGAGSITFTPKLLRDMLHFSALGGGTMRLVDVDEKRLRITYELGAMNQRPYDTLVGKPPVAHYRVGRALARAKHDLHGGARPAVAHVCSEYS